MTPEEKANQLVNRMLNCTEVNKPKLAALIVVDEILATDQSLNYYSTFDKIYTGTEYWQQVRTEIEKI